MTIIELKEYLHTLLASSDINKITGAELRQAFDGLIDTLVENGLVVGINPQSVPNQDSENVVYIALEDGVYQYFGNINVQNEVALITLQDKTWVKQSYKIPAQINHVEVATDTKGEDTPSADAEIEGDTLKITLYDIKGEKGEKGDPVHLAMEIDADDIAGEGTPSATIKEVTPDEGFDKKFKITVANLKGEKGDKGNNAVNPFKGIYGSDNKPTGTFASGDYIYAPTSASGQTGNTIWKWNGTTWQDSGETPDLANGETFASSETLQQVAIDNSGLVNPVNTADSTKPVLARAEDVMQLKAKLEGVTASEIKANQTIEDSTKFENGSVSSGASTDAVAVINVVGKKKVRFLGLSLKSNSGAKDLCYGFFSSDDLSGEPLWYKKFDQGNSSVFKEYTIDVPEGATMFVAPIRRSGWNTYETSFYCYLKNGESVGDSLNHIDGEINRIDKKFLQFEIFNPYQVKKDVFIQDGEGRYVKRSTVWEIIVYDLNDIDTDLYFNQINSLISRQATYVSALDYTGWPTTSSDAQAVLILNYVGYQNLNVGDKLEIPNGAKYVLIEHYIDHGDIQLLKSIDKFDDIYEDIYEINESLNKIEDKSKTYQPLKQYTQKTDYYIDSNYKAHRSTNNKLIVFDIQGKEDLNFKTERESVATRYAVYVSEVDFSNIQKNSLYDINYKVGEQSYKDGDALSIPDGANYVIVSYQYKGTSNPNPVYIADVVERYDNIESRIDNLEQNIKTNLPVYYKDFIENKVVEINDIFNSGIFKHTGNTPPTGSYKEGFVFYSDPHYPENYMMTGKVMAEIIKNTPINKLINGGDIVCSNATEVSGYENDTAGAIRRTIDLLEKDISPVIEAGAEYFQVRGNHDFSTKQKNNNDDNDNETQFLLVKDVYSYIMSKNMRNPNVVIGSNTDDACCFYKDFVASKLRYIFLDLEDANDTYSNSNNTMKRGYSNKQHKWFCQALLSTPSDYNIVVISHQPVLVGVYAIDSSYTNEHYNVYNKVMEAMLAVNNKESYVFDNITYDFIDFAPKILMHQCGHTHSDRIAYNGVWENSIASAREGTHQGMEYFFNTSVDNSLVEGTVNESLSDAIIIDNNLEGDINCVRLGPGCNRIIHQQEYELTNTLDLSNYSQLTNLEEAGTIEWYCFDSDNNSYDASTTYSHPSVFRPWHIHATINENGVVSVAHPTQQDLDKIPDIYYYGGTTQIAYKPNKNISGYVTVIAYSADLRIMEFFGVKVITEG